MLTRKKPTSITVLTDYWLQNARHAPQAMLQLWLLPERTAMKTTKEH
ncbi:TPA: hypothetical protein ACHK4K_004963 [Escherichia coli]